MARAKDLAALAGLAGLAYAYDKNKGGSSKGPSATAAEDEAFKVRMDAQKNAVSGNRVTNESSYTGTTKNDSNAAKNIGFGGGDDSDKNLKRVDSEVKPKPVVVKPKPAVAADEPAGFTTPVSSANRTDQLADLSRAVKREEKTKKAAQSDFGSGYSRTFGNPEKQKLHDKIEKQTGSLTASAHKTDALAVASRAARAADAKRRAVKQSSYKSGGMTSSASSRADGIATKGKTRGKIC
jgi:hypothetical protein